VILQEAKGTGPPISKVVS